MEFFSALGLDALIALFCGTLAGVILSIVFEWRGLISKW